jgi:hypothetical protein
MLEMMDNITIYPAHSDAQVADDANAYLYSDLKFSTSSFVVDLAVPH